MLTTVSSKNDILSIKIVEFCQLFWGGRACNILTAHPQVENHCVNVLNVTKFNRNTQGERHKILLALHLFDLISLSCVPAVIILLVVHSTGQTVVIHSHLCSPLDLQPAY